jgi:hypothetical protein
VATREREAQLEELVAAGYIFFDSAQFQKLVGD